MAIDGTFLKGFYAQTLLLSVTVDANGQYLLLAWAVVESENKNSWEYFFQHLSYSIPQILNSTVISDRDKGLLSAEDILGPNVTRLLCLHHLKANFIKHYGRKHIALFWPIANATTNEEYQYAMSELRVNNPTAASYLQNVNAQMWVTAFIPDCARRRCGQRTSNTAERLNVILQNTRQLPIIELLKGIWEYVMNERFVRQQRIEMRITQPSSQPWPPSIRDKVQYARKNARKHLVIHATLTLGQAGNYIVDLIQRTCGCGVFQNTNLPCEHAVAYIWNMERYSTGLQLSSYIPVEYTSEAWQRTYANNLQPVQYDIIEETH